MCWGCKATCNNCKPAEQLYATCPECGFPNGFTRDQFLMYYNLPHRKSDKEVEIRKSWNGTVPACEKCGADMTQTLRDEVTPAACVQSHIICGYPCGQRKVPLPPGRKPCTKMVPLARYRGDLSEEK